jgi:tripartite-type tricarboxylate transporter receptor subunit TctC
MGSDVEKTNRPQFGLTRRATVAGLLATGARAPAALAATPDAKDVYRGVQLRIIVGFPPGGGFDLYARMLAQYLPRYLPDVRCIVENMPGASTARAAAYIYGSGPQDGTVIGICHQGLLANQVLGIPNAGAFDVLKFNWIGRMGGQLNIGVAWHATGVRTIEDLKTKPIVFGATAPTATSVMIPKALNHFVGTKIEIVPGYQGSADMNLAMERGEIQGFATEVWIDLLNTHAKWLSDKTIFPLFLVGAERNPAMPDTPTLGELTNEPDDKMILEILASTADMGRTFMAGPNVPPERVAVLRDAFAAMMKDPELLAEARKQNLEIAPMHGAALQDFVAKIGRTPPEVGAKAKKILMT